MYELVYELVNGGHAKYRRFYIILLCTPRVFLSFSPKLRATACSAKWGINLQKKLIIPINLDVVLGLLGLRKVLVHSGSICTMRRDKKSQKTSSYQNDKVCLFPVRKYFMQMFHVLLPSFRVDSNHQVGWTHI